ncbi:sensor histidine kinase [Phenylobacterium sp. LjRoot225]|uniref:sensor histidine kinase n=1 Tax=Phenylobacterium sp. LjRoot225 TaxID=3342285 RepID=UPI003ECD684D
MLEGPDTRPEPTTVEALQAALDRERERAREVDHRAKNSLQLVSSLLLLQGRRSAAPETQRAMKAMHQRVGAVAAVHREILDAPDSDRFNLTAFIREHVSTLARAQGGGAVVHLDLAPVEVSAAQACPMALMVNELAQNALTHGAATGRPAEVTVRLEPVGGGFALTVQDEGPGLPPGSADGGFGLFMTRLLTQQLGADVAWKDAQPGLQVVVTVP